MRWLPLLSLLSCSPAPACETACGMVLVSGDCAELRAAEAQVVEAFSALYPPHDACRALDGVTVEVFPAARMPRVRGLTEGRRVWVADDVPLLAGLAHEVGGHVLDRALAGVSDPTHSTWEARGVWAAIGAVSPVRASCAAAPVLTGAVGGSL